ncbi:fructosamine kinase family protein [Nocardioides jishulii]|uniref:Fructosamine kinase n=1 Tax=Nocardioides jishulii TaxID=2575440 RepID=A0A4U2YR70_9ACTN|nr:fructosamine kinase family protein [Nocardioides jishulii]QCX26260.1 fructosamine kinase [Nocardioides jishulii]TKI63936.1 fructosamine kinase [Nocardioides jishulii]
MTRAPLVAKRAEGLLGRAVVSTAPVAGGDIATAHRLRLNDGTTALMKTLPRPPEGFFEAEARGLAWLREVVDGAPVAELLAVDTDCLIVRWIEPGRATQEAAADFGARLARTHAAGATAYGAVGDTNVDGFIGRLPMPNRTAATWAEFYATRRVLPYLKLARDRGAILENDATAIESLVGRLPDLVPEEGPARLHGDLWNGNCLWGMDGQVHLIDPAAHGGHRETDLAMLALFGLPHLARAVAGYTEVAPLADGWEERQGIHQLFPLLVHACMFGGSYGARAGAIAARF